MVKCHVQWNLSNTDTPGTKIIVLISEMSLFQRENIMYLYYVSILCIYIMYLYYVGTRSSVLINQVVLISELFFKRSWFYRIQRLARVKAMSNSLMLNYILEHTCSSFSNFLVHTYSCKVSGLHTNLSHAILSSGIHKDNIKLSVV